MQLGEALHDQLARVLDLFRSWDANEDHMISKKEFRRALAELGVQADEEVVASLFQVAPGTAVTVVTFVSVVTSVRASHTSVMVSSRHTSATGLPPHTYTRLPMLATCPARLATWPIGITLHPSSSFRRRGTRTAAARSHTTRCTRTCGV